MRAFRELAPMPETQKPLYNTGARVVGLGRFELPTS